MSTPGKFWELVTSRAFLVVAGLAIVGIGVGVGKSMLRRMEVEREIAALQGDISSLESKNEELARLINYFQTPEFKERSDRLERGLQKPGERVVVIPGLGQGTEITSTGVQASQPNWLRWFGYFFP
jgi:cell division protein FtsB